MTAASPAYSSSFNGQPWNQDAAGSVVLCRLHTSVCVQATACCGAQTGLFRLKPEKSRPMSSHIRWLRAGGEAGRESLCCVMCRDLGLNKATWSLWLDRMHGGTPLAHISKYFPHNAESVLYALSWFTLQLKRSCKGTRTGQDTNVHSTTTGQDLVCRHSQWHCRTRGMSRLLVGSSAVHPSHPEGYGDSDRVMPMCSGLHGIIES